jgi:hypothetical protein
LAPNLLEPEIQISESRGSVDANIGDLIARAGVLPAVSEGRKAAVGIAFRFGHLMPQGIGHAIDAYRAVGADIRSTVLVRHDNVAEPAEASLRRRGNAVVSEEAVIRVARGVAARGDVYSRSDEDNVDGIGIGNRKHAGSDPLADLGGDARVVDGGSRSAFGYDFLARPVAGQNGIQRLLIFSEHPGEPG